MLTIINSMSELKFFDLMNIYTEGNKENGAQRYPQYSSSEQILAAEQDFYQYLNSVFFCQKDSFYAVWEADGEYVAALRIEPYRDGGYLLCALETAPIARRRGFASKLITSVLTYLAQRGSGTVFSHISRNNAASIGVHSKCGFTKVMDYAVYSDGSIMSDIYTYAVQC